MKVNFNNVRKQAIYRYDSLVEKLNKAILKDDQWAKPNDVYHGQEMNIKGYVLIDAEDLQKDLDDLRMLIGTIACTYEEGNEDFANVYDEVFPEEKEERMQSFNDEVEVW